MKKDKIITIRVNERDKKKLIEKSKIAKLSLSEYLIEQGLDKDIVIVNGLNAVIIVKVKKFFEKYFGLGTADENDDDFEYRVTDEEESYDLNMVAEEGEKYKNNI